LTTTADRAAATRRIVVVSTEFFSPGGVQSVSRQAVDVLKTAATVEAWSLCDRGLPADTTPAAGVRFRFAAGSDWQLGRWALGAALTGDDDAVLLLMHLHLAPLAIPWLARRRRVVVFLYGVEAWRPLSPLQQFVLARADLVAISRYTADRFKEANPGVSTTRLNVCTLGIETDTPATGSDRPVPGFALMVSRLSSEDRYKGHEQVIRAWQAVRARVPGATLAIVGDGDDRQRLEALVRTLGLEDSIHFAGRVSDAELPGWYEQSELFLLPSGQEGFGLVFLEAMRASKPCVSGPGAPESIVEDGKTGFIVTADDSPRLVDVTVALFRDRALRDRLGSNGRIKFLREFTAERFAERLRSLVIPTGAEGQTA